MDKTGGSGVVRGYPHAQRNVATIGLLAWAGVALRGAGSGAEKGEEAH